MKRVSTPPLPARHARWSTISRPGDVGIDLPAGASAVTLTPGDYRPLDMERPEPEAPPARPAPRRRARARSRRAPRTAR